MKNTVNTIKKIAAFGAALTMAVSAMGITASAADYDVTGFSSVVCAENGVRLSASSLTLEPGTSTQITVSSECHHLKVKSTNASVATAKWDADGFIGDTVVCNIKAVNGGACKIKIISTEDGSVLASVTVNVKSREAEKSAAYSAVYSFYNFDTGFYYRTSGDAAAASSRGMNSVYQGRVEALAVSDAAHTYYSSFTGCYYTNYAMAVAASRGYSAYVTQEKPYSTAYSAAYPYYSFETGYYYASYQAAAADSGCSDAVYFGKLDAVYTLDGRHTYHSTYTGWYYSDYNMALAASRGMSGYVTQETVYDDSCSSSYDSVHCYYSFTTGYYYASFEAAAKNSYNSDCVYFGRVDSSMSYDAAHIYFSSYTGSYYASYDMALAASMGNRSNVSYDTGDYVYEEATVSPYMI